MIYQLKSSIRDEQGVIYTISTRGGKMENDKIKAAINTKSVWKEDFDITVYFDESHGSGPFRFLDTHSWKLGFPLAHVFVVSKRLKDVISRYRLPSHAFYRIRISSGKDSVDYYLLHLLYTNKIEIDYEKTAFRKFDIFTDKPLSIGEVQVFFNDYEDFQSKQRELVSSSGNKVYFESDRYVYKTEYDIFWGHAYSIFVNEKVKTELEASDLKGLNIPEFKKYEVKFLPL